MRGDPLNHLIVFVALVSVFATVALSVGCLMTLRGGEKTVLKNPGFWILILILLFSFPCISAPLLGIILCFRILGRRAEREEEERELARWESQGRREVARLAREQQAEERRRAEHERTVAQKQKAQDRRRDARAACELLYLQLAPEIGSRFSMSMFSAWVDKYLADDYAPEEVERRAEQLKGILRQHHKEAVKEPERKSREAEEQRRRREAEEQENQELLRQMIRQREADERESERVARRNKSLAKRIQEILAMNYPEAVRERKIAELLQGVDRPDAEPGRVITGDDE